MTKTLITIASLSSLAIGYLAISPWWLLLLAFGYFFPQCLMRYNETMALIENERIGLVTISFIWIYVASIIGVSLMYGVGTIIEWLVD